MVEKQDLVRETKRSIEQVQLRLNEQEKNYQSSIHSGNIAVFRNEEQLKEIEKQIGTLTSKLPARTENSQSISKRFCLSTPIAIPIKATQSQISVQPCGIIFL